MKAGRLVLCAPALAKPIASSAARSNNGQKPHGADRLSSIRPRQPAFLAAARRRAHRGPLGGPSTGLIVRFPPSVRA